MIQDEVAVSLLVEKGCVGLLVVTVMENSDGNKGAENATSKEALGTNDTAYFLKHAQAMAAAVALFESASLVGGMGDVLISQGAIPMQRRTFV